MAKLLVDHIGMVIIGLLCPIFTIVYIIIRAKEGNHFISKLKVILSGLVMCFSLACLVITIGGIIQGQAIKHSHAEQAVASLGLKPGKYSIDLHKYPTKDAIYGGDGYIRLIMKDDAETVAYLVTNTGSSLKLQKQLPMPVKDVSEIQIKP